MLYTDHKFYKAFNELSLFFRSIAAIIIFMFLLFTFQMLETATLFNGLLNVKMPDARIRVSACIIISMVIEYSQFLFTVNKDSFENKKVQLWVPKVIGIISLTINLAFFSVWVGNWDEIAIKLILSFTLAFLTYFYTELYIAKWKEIERLLGWKDEQQKAENLLVQQKHQISEKEKAQAIRQKEQDETERVLSERKQAIEAEEKQRFDTCQKLKELKLQLKTSENEQSEIESAKSELELSVTNLKATLSELQAEEKRINQYIKDSTCECGKIHTSPQAKIAHQRACEIAIAAKKEKEKILV